MVRIHARRAALQARPPTAHPPPRRGAANKPPWLITAPKHRFTGGSLVNRVIGALGFEPLTLHRLDMQTSGVVLFGRTRRAVAPVHEQFRRAGRQGWSLRMCASTLLRLLLLLHPAPTLLAPTPHPTRARRKTVRKEYLALALGVPNEAEFSVDAPIGRDPVEK